MNKTTFTKTVTTIMEWVSEEDDECEEEEGSTRRLSPQVRSSLSESIDRTNCMFWYAEVHL